VHKSSGGGSDDEDLDFHDFYYSFDV